MPPETDDIDQILSEIEKPDEGRPMGGDEGAAPTSETPAASAPPPSDWDGKAWEFDWNGKKVAPDSRDKAHQWMRLGYNHSQRQFEHNQAVKAWEQQKAEAEARYRGYDKFEHINRFIQEDPSGKDWWDHVQKAWESRGQVPQGAPGSPDIQAIVAPLQQQLQELSAWRNEHLQERQRQQIEQADKALSSEIESIREQNPNLDFDSVDETGKSLESRILEHATQIGTSSFRAAFRDYLHDKLIESAKAQHLSAQAKAPQQQKAAGILGVSPTPRKGREAPVSVKGRSWDDVAGLAMDEYQVS